jgi:hypothetical protein
VAPAADRATDAPAAARDDHDETVARRKIRRTVPAHYAFPVLVGSRSALICAAISA